MQKVSTSLHASGCFIWMHRVEVLACVRDLTVLGWTGFEHHLTVRHAAAPRRLCSQASREEMLLAAVNCERAKTGREPVQVRHKCMSTARQCSEV